MGIMHTGLNHYLFLAAILISLGLYGMIFRKDTISVIFSFQIVMSGINIMLAAFTRFTAAGSDGYTLSILLIFTSAVQVIGLVMYSMKRFRENSAGGADKKGV